MHYFLLYILQESTLSALLDSNWWYSTYIKCLIYFMLYWNTIQPTQKKTYFGIVFMIKDVLFSISVLDCQSIWLFFHSYLHARVKTYHTEWFSDHVTSYHLPTKLLGISSIKIHGSWIRPLTKKSFRKVGFLCYKTKNWRQDFTFDNADYFSTITIAYHNC